MNDGFPINYKDFAIPLPSGAIGVLRVPFPLSKEDSELLFVAIELFKKSLMEQAK